MDAAQIPGWQVWRSRVGHWYATRTGRPLTDREFGVGMYATVDAADLDELRAEVQRQRTAEDRARQVVAR